MPPKYPQSQPVTLIKAGPEFRFVKQLVLVQIVKLGDFKTPISLLKTLCFKICTTTSYFTNLISGPGSMNLCRGMPQRARGRASRPVPKSVGRGEEANSSKINPNGKHHQN